MPNTDKIISTSNTIEKPYTKNFIINDNKISITLNEAKFRVISGEEILLDQISIDFMMEEMLNAIKTNTLKYAEIPTNIIITSNSIPNFNNISCDTVDNPSVLVEEDKTTPLDTKTLDNEDYIKRYQPRFTVDEVFVDPESKRKIMSALIIARERNKLYNEWGLIKTLKTNRPLVLNFYGPPGTGKTMMAEAIAHYLGREVFSVNYSEIESGTSGDTAKKLMKVFEKGSEANAVLIFDEADSFLGKRLTNVTSAADYGINITRSVMLIEIERFQGIMIFTTNFISNYDIAFKRRILASVEFRLPDEKGRAQIWAVHIPKELPLDSGITPLNLALKYGGTSGGDIKDILLYAAVNALEQNREKLIWDDFDKAYASVKNRYSVI